MNVGSVFSGIGGLDEGLRRAGHTHVFFCESDAYRRDVLRARFPGVSVFEDVREVDAASLGRGCGTVESVGARADTEWDGSALPIEPVDVDLLCGGFPCQDLSVAGRRAGLAGDRSGLFFEFTRIAESLRPSWLLVENVPGLLSSNGGRDFGVVLGTLADIGYGLAWRIVDSRFFGVPQRRRRVFIVGTFADGDPRVAAERAGEVLAVGSGCDWHLAKGREARENAPVASLSGLGSGGPDDNDGQGGRLISEATERATPRAVEGLRVPSGPFVSETVRSHPRPGSNSNGNLIYQESEYGVQGYDTAGTLREGRIPEHQMVAAPLTKRSATGEGVNQPGRRQEDDVNIVSFDAEYSNQASLGDDKAMLTRKLRRAISSPSQGVRRLTPTECERLQGFPDDWTQLGDTPDSRRYSALGDAVTVNVSKWIGERLARSARRVAA